MKAERGVTLIELMITLVVLSIIVAVAFPAYTAYAQRARRTDGTAALNKATMAMESWRANNATYTGGSVAGESEQRFYDVGVTITNGGLGYALTATGKGAQAKDSKCVTLTLNSQGTKGYTGSALDAATCWGD